METMRAAVAERPDGADGLVVREVPRPEQRAGWALVKVEAFGLNRSEYMTLRGWSGDAVRFPRILGIRSGSAYHSDEASNARHGLALLQPVVEQVERGLVDPGIDTVYALEEIAEGHRRMAAGAATGKLVVVSGRRPGAGEAGT